MSPAVLILGPIVGGLVALALGVIVLGRYLKSHPASRWRWIWRLLAFPLAALGAYAVVGLTIAELREKRVGLGLGVTVALLLSLIAAFLPTRSRQP